MDNKTRVSFRLDLDTKEQLKKIAESHGLTLSSYLSLITTKIIKEFDNNINKTDND